MNDKQEVLDAIHALELSLTERIHTQTEVMGVTNERLENLRASVDRHRELLYGHDDGINVGLVAEMSNLTQKETERKWTMRTVVISFFGLLGKFVWDLFHA